MCQKYQAKTKRIVVLHWHIFFVARYLNESLLFFMLKSYSFVKLCIERLLLFLTLIRLLSYILIISPEHEFPFSNDTAPNTVQYIKLLLLIKKCDRGKSALFQVII